MFDWKHLIMNGTISKQIIHFHIKRGNITIRECISEYNFLSHPGSLNIQFIHNHRDGDFDICLVSVPYI